jgi:hypothetical protein
MLLKTKAITCFKENVIENKEVMFSALSVAGLRLEISDFRGASGNALRYNWRPVWRRQIGDFRFQEAPISTQPSTGCKLMAES